MTITPMVTIAIPTYNRADQLRRCLASALAQDYAALEVIVCDNASTDRTAEVVADFTRMDHRITYYRHETNLGALENFRRGIDAARGEYFMWLADDDWIDVDFVGRCMAALYANPAAVLANGEARYYEPNGEVTVEPATNVAHTSPVRRMLGYYATVVRNGAFYGLSRTADRRQAPFDDRFGSDWVSVASMALKGPVIAAGTVIHRSAAGTSSSLGSGWGPFVVSLTLLVSRASLQQSTLAPMSFVSRVAIAIGSGVIVLGRFGTSTLIHAAARRGRPLS